MISSPFVSVLMPVYNGEKYLAEAIESILNQVFTNFELIICDDASTDSSNSIIKQFKDDRIIFVENEKNLGIVRTRNKLFSLAKGDFYSIMDCDDIAYPKKLDKQITFMLHNPNYGLCGTWARKISTSEKIIGYIQPPQKNEDIRINMLFQSPFIQSTVLIRKEILGDLKYDENFPVAEDFDLWERLSGKTWMYNLPSVLLDYRLHNTNISHEKNLLMSEKRDQIIKRQLDNFCIIDHSELKVIITIGNLLPLKNEEMHNLFSKAYTCFSKLINANQKTKIFNQDSFIAFILYRWIFYCISQKRYKYSFSLSLRKINFNIFRKLIGLIGKKIIYKSHVKI